MYYSSSGRMIHSFTFRQLYFLGGGGALLQARHKYIFAYIVFTILAYIRESNYWQRKSNKLIFYRLMYSSVHFDLAVNQHLLLYWQLSKVDRNYHTCEVLPVWNSSVPNKDQFAMVHFMSICIQRNIIILWKITKFKSLVFGRIHLICTW